MKLGFVSMPLSGHLNPMTALARRLQSRGHEAVFLGVPDVEPFVRAAGLRFVPFGGREFPAGSVAKLWSEVARRHGLDVVRYTCRELNPNLIRVGLEYLPATLQRTGVDAVIIDTISFFNELAPMSMGIPYVHIWNVLHLDFSGRTPVGLLSWPHDTTPEGLERNAEGLQEAGALFAPMIAAARPYAEKMGLEIDFSDPGSTTSKLAVITQTPREFDFPSAPWPPQFHYAGPFHDGAGREPVSFPWEKLTGAPLIYASLGTLVNGLNHVYSAILRAVEKLPWTQVVLSVGENLDLDELGAIPSNVIIVRSAPQIELLKRATLAITHAGLNTDLRSEEHTSELQSLRPLVSRFMLRSAPISSRFPYTTLFRSSAILRAVEKLPWTQVVLSVGENLDLDELGAIPSNVIIVRSAPQIELLKRATLAITHAGLNTVL